MDPDQVLTSGERGFHVLFDTKVISAAFEQDAGSLRRVVDARAKDFQQALAELLGQPSAERGRRFIAALPHDFQYLIVLLYFDLLDSRVRARAALH